MVDHVAGADARAGAGASADIAVYEAVRAHELMLNEATAAFEHAVLAPLFLLNGGAAVAFLTLAGAASGDDTSLSIHPGVAVAAAVAWVVGLLAAAGATWCGFKVQQSFSVAARWRRQRIELELLDVSWDIRQLVVNRALMAVDVDGREPALENWRDSAITRLDGEAAEKAAWWRDGRRRLVGVLIVLSVLCFSTGAGFAGASLVI